MLGQFLGELRRRNVVRVAAVYVVTAWGLFQVLNTVLQVLDAPAWGAKLVLVLLVAGLPFAVIIAWAFERGPDGAVHLTRPEAGARQPLRIVDVSLLAALLAVLALTGAQMAGVAPSLGGGRATIVGARAPEKSVAVLPFADFSAQQDSEYFTDGLTEEVINSLAQIPDLKVAGRTSAFYFKGKSEDLREIGRKLGVAHVVEGSVRRDGDHLRVTAQLISVKDGFHLWSKTYDRKLDDALAIQTEIANAVADALQTRLASEAPAKGAPRDPAAYRLQLTARAHLRRWGLDDLQAARQQFERLTTLEPNNASAYAGYAQATLLIAQNHLALDFDEARRLSEAAVDKALQLDPKSVDGLIAKAFLNRVMAIRTGAARYEAESARAVEQALAVDPRNPEALSLYADHLAHGGKTRDALTYANRALAADPLNRLTQMVVANSLSSLGQSEAAARQYRAVIDLFPDFDDGKAALAGELMNRGRLDEAEPWMKAVAETGKDPGSALQLALIYTNLGLSGDAEATLKAIKEPPAAANIATAARLLMTEDYRKALSFSEAQRSRDRDPIWVSAVVISGSHTGDLDKAHTALAELSPELFLPEPKVGDLDTALYAAHALNAAGDRAQARRILDRVLQITAGPPGGYRPNSWRIAAVRAYAELGDKEAALRELKAAVQAGWRTPFRLDDFTWLDRNPNTRSLQDDPRFKALMAEVRADLARQRANVLALRR